MEKIIQNMANELEKVAKVVPVYCASYDLKTKNIIVESLNENVDKKYRRDVKEKNRTKSKRFESTSHAEQVVIRKMKESGNIEREFGIIVNIPPCEYCLEHLFNEENLTEIQIISDYQLEYKKERYFKNTGKSELKIVPKLFNNNGHKRLISLTNDIKKKYFEFYTWNYLIPWYKINFFDIKKDNVYIDEETYCKFKTPFKIIDLLTSDFDNNINNIVYNKNINGKKIRKIRVQKIHEFISGLDKEKLEKIYKSKSSIDEKKYLDMKLLS